MYISLGHPRASVILLFMQWLFLISVLHVMLWAYGLLSDYNHFHCTGGTEQSLTATHDSFLLYSDDAKEAQSWILAISRVMNEVCNKLCIIYNNV